MIKPQEILLYRDQTRCRTIVYFPKSNSYEIVFQNGNIVQRFNIKSEELRVLTDMLKIAIDWENHGILPDRDGEEVRIVRPIATFNVL